MNYVINLLECQAEVNRDNGHYKKAEEIEQAVKILKDKSNIDPNDAAVLIEFGFKAHEKGHNLQATIRNYATLFKIVNNKDK